MDYKEKIRRFDKKVPHIRHYREKLNDKDIDYSNKVRFYFVIYNASSHELIKDKILEQFTSMPFSSSIENETSSEGYRNKSAMKFLAYYFDTVRVPDKIDWDKITTMPVVEDKNLSSKNKKGLEKYLSSLFNKS